MFTTNDLYNKIIISIIITIIYILITIFIKLTTEIKNCKSLIKNKKSYIYRKKTVIIIRSILIFISSFVLIDFYSKSIKPKPITKQKIIEKKYNLKNTVEKNLTDNNDLISIF